MSRACGKSRKQKSIRFCLEKQLLFNREYSKVGIISNKNTYTTLLPSFASQSTFDKKI